MPAPYNLTMISNVTNPASLSIGLNNQSGGLLGITLLVVVFVIALFNLLTRGYPFREGFAASSFFMFVLALLLWPLGLVTEYILFIGVLMVLGGLLGLLIRN